MTVIALTGARIFDGERLRDGEAVLIDGTRIAGIVATGDVPADAEQRAVDGLIAPGFVDVQVNGGGGVLFNDARTVEGIAAIGAAHRRYGTTGFLPTLITDSFEATTEAMAAAEEALAKGVPGLLGIHLEGPFLNPERKGAHQASFMRPVEEADIALMTGLTRGRTLVTLAPEMVSTQTIARLASAGVLVSAGHTAASYETIRAARAAGLTAFTHLYNAMPPLTGREPGPVGAALDDFDAWCGLIVDLVHVSAPSLRVAINARGWERMMLITDAMSSVGSELGEFVLHGRTVTRERGRLTMEDGTLAGSDLDMATAVRNTVEALGLPLEIALRMASRTPAEFLGLDDEIGQIAPGFRADLVLLDAGLTVQQTWINGSDA
ncbi:N-acetylglucosamine-6-phosphate deacetylase [Bauldia litoralis]|uniref:N-acetylglucosamine-6-phosphate deacetylase n=1 Tax=Bauldia litoralis TaxID=665467 RepID=A0A1G6DR77_9HYPH|nr:N-acetylglucosamine-6-phosphate deacetylase [Bauldia litoralis]SDB47295.1 N-acetylglucosamine-6-phosphate deacetylase [Bauldia litoralis]